MKRTPNFLAPWLLLSALLFLPGCEDEVTWARLGMLYSPLSYGLGLATLLSLAKRWSFRAPEVARRPQILAAPAVVLGVAALAMLATLTAAERAGVFRLLAPNLLMLIVMLTTAPLMGVLGLIWRLWFALDPRRSVEGTAILGSALFFLPGLLVIGGMLPDRQAQGNVIAMFVAACLFGAYIGPIVLALLGLEAWLAQRRHERASRLTID